MARGADLTVPGLYRVLGLPGDRLRWKDASYEIKAGEGQGFLPENAAVGRNYQVTGRPRGALPDSDAPENQEILLAGGEYYVAYDNRSTLDGSALWGPVSLDRVEGRIFLAFWPLKHAKFL